MAVNQSVKKGAFLIVKEGNYLIVKEGTYLIRAGSESFLPQG